MMPDWSSFTNEDWWSLLSLIIALLALAANICIAIVGNMVTNRKLANLEKSMNDGMRELGEKVAETDRLTAYLAGVLDGAGITPRRR